MKIDPPKRIFEMSKMPYSRGLLGALVFTFVPNLIGRKKTFIVAGAFATLGSVMQCTSSGVISLFYIGRFICGIGLGMMSTICPLLLSETAPTAIRGAILSMHGL
jgi:MFS family permease